jgi:hypothetical protein
MALQLNLNLQSSLQGVSTQNNSNQSTNKINGVRPTFLLRGIDSIEITRKYLNGYYANVTLPNNKVATIKRAVTTERRGGVNSDSQIYTVRQGINGISYRVTTNHSYYQIAKNGQKLYKGVCNWYRVTFDSHIVGIPTTMTQHYNESTKQTEYQFNVDGCFCSFECAFAYLKQTQSCALEHRNNKYAHSEQLLKFMYKLCYPDAERLTSANDWRLIDFNGGPLTFEEWSNESHIYVENSKSTMVPVKYEYERQNR